MFLALSLLLACIIFPAIACTSPPQQSPNVLSESPGLYAQLLEAAVHIRAGSKTKLTNGSDGVVNSKYIQDNGDSIWDLAVGKGSNIVKLIAFLSAVSHSPSPPNGMLWLRMGGANVTRGYQRKPQGMVPTGGMPPRSSNCQRTIRRTFNTTPDSSRTSRLVLQPIEARGNPTAT
jgi:hypothetical protein